MESIQFGTEQANKIAEKMLALAEENFLTPISSDVRADVVKQMGGIFKTLYQRIDGMLGHAGIEKNRRDNAHRIVEVKRIKSA